MNHIVDYYEKLAESYDKNRFDNTYGKFIDKQERILLNRLLTNENEEILDLACGSGRLLNYAKYGIDASAKMIEIAEQKYKDKSIFIADAENTPFESGSIDTIISFHFFMHLDNEKIKRILAECHRILRNNGRIIFDVPSKKRRNLFKYKTGEWHGAYSTTFDEFKFKEGFRIKRTGGILFFPIHRFPKFIRNMLVKTDLFLANSLLKEYSSYLLIELIKNEAD